MWDDANMQRVCADATKVTAGREGIVLLFGMNQSRQPGEKEIKVQLSERIVLSPTSAKRLSILVSNALQDHDREFEKFDIETHGQAESVAGDTTAPGRYQDVVFWDETRMTSTYANTAQVTGSQEGVSIFFGVEKARQAGQNEVQVQLSRHVSLSPTVAKQLAIGLNNAIRSHETRCGEQEPVAAVPVTEQKVRPHENGGASGSEERVQKVLTLFQQMGGLDAKIDFEHSFKAVHNHLFEDRFLLGINRQETEGSRDERIAFICENIGMPHNLLASFKRSLPDANHVYFGLERNDQTLLFKVYLEFRGNIEKEIGGAPVAGRSFPLFTGFKWDTFSPTRQAVSRYTWYPSLPVPEILKRVQMTIDPSRHSGLLAIVQRIAKRASERISHSDIQYVEVTEEGNPRRSFDINIYKSGLRLEDLAPDLLRALRHYAIPFSRFESLYQRIKTERFGHLAGGVDRENKDFMTVYYGVKDIHSSQLGSATIVQGNRRPNHRG